MTLASAKILVVGGAGFVGSNLCKTLLGYQPKEIIIVDNLLSAEISQVPSGKNVTFIQGSITNDTILENLPSDLDYVFHLATYHGNQSSIHNPLADHENNTLTSLKLFDRIKSFPHLKKVIYASAGCTVAQKTFSEAKATTEDDNVSLFLDSPYQISKIIGELYGNYYCHGYRLPFVKARFQNVYGPGEILGAGQWRGTVHTVWRNVIPTFIFQALHQDALPVENNGIATRDFIYIDDIVAGLIACALNGEPGEVYNLASGEETSILELANYVNTMTNNPTAINFKSARDWDRSGKRYGEITKAKSKIDFEAKVGIKEGLIKTVQWTQENMGVIKNAMFRHANNVPQINKYLEGYEGIENKTKEIDIKFPHSDISPVEFKPLNILVLYDASDIQIGTVNEHLRSFKKYSTHNIYYATAAGYVDCKLDLSVFDVIVIHYSIRVNMDNTAQSLSPSYIKALKDYVGHKVLFIQDEYDTTNVAKSKILDIGINTVFTTVPAEYLEYVYPKSEFKHVEFVHNLTGYVSENLNGFNKVPPLQEREIWIGYRGRDLPFLYGTLGREKFYIGKEMKRICEEKSIPADIEWEANKRIYGDDWYKFLSNCRATLGTESGSNVFDFTGQIRLDIETALKKDPNLPYKVIYEKYLQQHENKIAMNQVSPKIFESIILRTALILFEGTYSGIIKPNVHYIELKKDFSNVDAVLSKVADDNYINELTTRAYNDIVKSGWFSYKNFIRKFDNHLNNNVTYKNSAQIIPILYVSSNKTSSSSSNSFTHRRMLRNLLSNDVLQDISSLKTVNKISSKYLTNSEGNLSASFTQNIDKLLANPAVVKTLTKLNGVIPGKPVSKIYQTMKRFLKL